MSNEIMLKAVISRFQVEGVHSLHRDSKTSEEYQFADHRHLFHFEVTVNAFEDEDKLLNGIAIRRMCLKKFESTDGMYYFGFMQSLDIADWLCQALWKALDRGVRVQVLEDGENGAVVTYGTEMMK